MLFHHLLGQTDDIYISFGLLILPDRGRVEGLISVLQRVIDRHEILRTGFIWKNLERAGR